VVEKYQFDILLWVNLSEPAAKLASSWYQSPGWYFNTRDATGAVQSSRCVAPSDQANPHPESGQLEALNRCGAEGWSVAALVPASQTSPATKVVQKLLGDVFSWDGPYFILQRRVAS
jgi:hypothetical protein